MGFSRGPKIVTDGLILALDAGNTKSYPGSGTTWNDLSGNGSNSTLYNTPTVRTDNSGNLGFNGSNEYAANTTLDLGTDPAALSIVMTIRRTGTISDGGTWGLGGAGSNTGLNNYSAGSRANKIGWDLWGKTTFDTGQNYPLDEWVNVCWIKNGSGMSTSTCTIFINGVSAPITYTLRNNSSTVNLADGYSLGRISPTFNNYYGSADIASFYIYEKVLTATEVLQNYNATKARFGL